MSEKNGVKNLLIEKKKKTVIQALFLAIFQSLPSHIEEGNTLTGLVRFSTYIPLNPYLRLNSAFSTGLTQCRSCVWYSQ